MDSYCSLLLPLLFFGTFVIISPCLLAAPLDVNYVNCSRLFECGKHPPVGFPFWGGERPEQCGLPGLKLECDSENTIITTTTPQVQFRVLELDPDKQKIKVAPEEFFHGRCLTQINISALNFSSIFQYAADDAISNLTLFYNCTPDLTLPSAFDGLRCIINEESMVLSIHGTAETCNGNITIPILQSMFQDLKERVTSVTDALMEGFELIWDEGPGNECRSCVESEGQCGYNLAGTRFACFCRDQPYPDTCGDENSKKGLVAGLAVGSAAIAGIVLLSAACIVRRRKLSIIADSNSKEAAAGRAPSSSTPKINGPSPPIASPLTDLSTAHSTHYYRTTPYANPKSDLESASTYLGVRVFSYEELEEATDDFDASRELGDGGFGIVYHGKLRDGRSVAVKRLYERNFKRVEQFMNEVEILTRLRHPNLVTLYGCTSRRSRELLLVYEYIPNGTLADHLHGTRSSPRDTGGSLSWPVRLSIAVETADALAYLHASDIIHRDVKTTNILLDLNFHVKVADFGLSRLFPNDVTHVSTAPQGTPGYVDPEYYHCYHLTDKSDVYSFGVVLVELVSAKQAVDTSRHRHDVNLASMAVNMIQNQSLHELVDPCLGFDNEGDCKVRRAVTAVAELAFRCLQPDQEMRPSMDEVVEGLRWIEKESSSNSNSDSSRSIISEEVKNKKKGGEGGGGVRMEVVVGDEVGLLKGNVVQSFSPDSVVDAQWVNSNSSHNTLSSW